MTWEASLLSKFKQIDFSLDRTFLVCNLPMANMVCFPHVMSVSVFAQGWVSLGTDHLHVQAWIQSSHAPPGLVFFNFITGVDTAIRRQAHERVFPVLTCPFETGIAGSSR